ncbi:TetR/AcrR family transcriptional regulator [Vibrio cholerae]|nr:TetR/AcrR family transcriptional regulator [Vibrio cholerae]TLE15510.1 TetR/AcrR family transcriptional regulator [Vibrio cholerae]TLE17328.1 TetR/AcrR family transcriptional regulator [Vibrio cholerae]TLE27947.1 TetR/AcrR family transcriptional regulator [Vibrio cholerae]
MEHLMTNSTVDKILDLAELQVRAGGYNSFSFREISKEIGIKSASIHYHFPTKADLGVAIATRYTERFSQKLAEILAGHGTAAARLTAYIDLFRQSLLCDQKMCLCGQLASESEVLPDPIRAATQQFFVQNLQWLALYVFAAAGLTAPVAEQRAAGLLASLEGALLMAKVLDDNAVFEQVNANLAALLP